jgi:hypothetical protein
MEKNISLFFSDLSLPSQNSKNYLIELFHDNKKEIITYPQSNPTIITLFLKSDKQILLINIKPKQNTKKQKIIFHGEIMIFKKLLQEKPLEKYIFLYSNDKDSERFKSNKDSGKIFVRIKLADETNINNITNQKERERERENEEMVEIIDTSIKNERKTDNNVFDDDISDIKAEPISKNELRAYNIDDIISIEGINKLKELIENEENKNSLFPNTDIDSLKYFNKNIFKEYKDLNEYYSNILTEISKNKEEIKEKAEKYNNDNEKLENELNKLRLETRQNREQLDQKIKENKEKDENISQNLEEIIIKERNLFEKLKKNGREEEKETKNYGDENDLKNICNLIKILNNLGYNIDDGDITDSEKQNLNDLLYNENTFKSNNNSQKMEQNNDDDIKENYELGNIIVTLIERDVNDLYMRKLIEQIKIDQIDAITYCFTGENKNKEVVFKLENNNLICSTGETFTVWLIKNFSL